MRVQTILLWVSAVAASASSVMAMDAPTPSAAPAPAEQAVAGHHHPHTTDKGKAKAAKQHDKLHQRQSKREAIRLAVLERRCLDISLLVGQLRTVQNQLTNSQQNIHGYRSQIQKNPRAGKSGPFQSSVANELRNYRAQSQSTTPILTDLSSSFGNFGEQKGLANYNKNSALQTLLKDLVDSQKYVLNDINYIVYKIPGLGPILGPIVYDLKCVIDILLNGSENTVDGLLNGISPQLTTLQSKMGVSLLKLGVPGGIGSGSL